MIIASGTRADILTEIMEGKEVGTYFPEYTDYIKGIKAKLNEAIIHINAMWGLYYRQKMFLL